MEVGAEVWVRDPGPETWVGGVVVKKVSATCVGGCCQFPYQLSEIAVVLNAARGACDIIGIAGCWGLLSIGAIA